MFVEVSDYDYEMFVIFFMRYTLLYTYGEIINKILLNSSSKSLTKTKYKKYKTKVKKFIFQRKSALFVISAFERFISIYGINENV